MDAAARKVITDAGFGPDHKVRGNKTTLAPGICFSNEPMIAIYGEFGIRLEDFMCTTEKRAKYFSEPSPAIDRPFA